MTNLVQSPGQTTVATKLAALRSRLTALNLDAYLVPSADEHLNEYLPEEKQRRKWLSGFTGSAGDFLVGVIPVGYLLTPGTTNRQIWKQMQPSFKWQKSGWKAIRL